MNKKLVLLVWMGALALGASAQTLNCDHVIVGSNAPKLCATATKGVTPDGKKSAADVIKKVGPNARVGATAPKTGPITRK